MDGDRGRGEPVRLALHLITPHLASPPPMQHKGMIPPENRVARLRRGLEGGAG
jgi:hypothetical protein